MKKSRRDFIQKVSLTALGLSIAPSFISKQVQKKAPHIIGIGQSGCSVLNQCYNNGILAKYYAIERREDRFIYPNKTLRAYVNPDNNGEYDINSFKGIAERWVKEILSSSDYSNNPVIIANSIGNEYETIAGRGVFDCLLENKVNVIWVVSYPFSNEGVRSTRTASQYTKDISHLPNVISLYKDEVSEKYADNILFNSVQIIIRKSA